MIIPKHSTTKTITASVIVAALITNAEVKAPPVPANPCNIPTQKDLFIGFIAISSPPFPCK